jgi:hypothetical protein
MSSKIGGNSDGRGILPVAVQRTTSSRRPRAVPEGLGANTLITTLRMVTSSHGISTLAAPALPHPPTAPPSPRARAPPREVSERRRLGWGKSVEDELQDAQFGAGGSGRQHPITMRRMATSSHRFNSPILSTYSTMRPRSRVLPHEVIEGRHGAMEVRISWRGS